MERVSEGARTDVDWLMLAATHLEFAFYFEGAARLRALAFAPMFCDESALEVIAKFSRMLEEEWDCDESDVGRVDELQRAALRVLRGEDEAVTDEVS